MENILKKLNSKWFLLFLFMFLSLGMRAQYSEDQYINQWITDALNDDEDSSISFPDDNSFADWVASSFDDIDTDSQVDSILNENSAGSSSSNNITGGPYYGGVNVYGVIRLYIGNADLPLGSSPAPGWMNTVEIKPIYIYIFPNGDVISSYDPAVPADPTVIVSVSSPTPAPTPVPTSNGDPCNVTVNFGSHVNINSINQCSLQLIKGIADKLGIDKFEISSAFRSAADQARVMFDNIKRDGVASQKALYGTNGDSVIDAYSVALAAGKSNDDIKQAMLDKINELGAYNVSNHSGDSNVLTAIDIRPSSIPLSNRSEFVNAINQAISNGEVSKFWHPGNSKDRAYHIEINVKNCNLINCN